MPPKMKSVHQKHKAKTSPNTNANIAVNIMDSAKDISVHIRAAIKSDDQCFMC